MTVDSDASPSPAGSATAEPVPGPRRPMSPAGARRAARRVAPERNSDHAHLDLAALRAYRTQLAEEEGRVSYWRRILQSRLDVVREGNLRGVGSLHHDHIRPVLTEQRVGSGRRSLVAVLPVDDIPPLPDLAELWDREVDAGSPAARAALEQDLAEAERQLSAYRSALHQRQSAATDDLIARYREQPALCLSVLPTQAPTGPRP